MEMTMRPVMLFILVIFVFATSSALAQQPPKTQQSPQVFSGTVENLDASHAKVTIKNDLGHDIPLQVLNPDLLKGISVGDRVSVEVEKAGTAKKITKLTVPELKAPLETGK
jgi:Cu/Ag efflux protein CusF